MQLLFFTIFAFGIYNTIFVEFGQQQRCGSTLHQQIGDTNNAITIIPREPLFIYLPLLRLTLAKRARAHRIDGAIVCVPPTLVSSNGMEEFCCCWYSIFHLLFCLDTRVFKCLLNKYIGHVCYFTFEQAQWFFISHFFFDFIYRNCRSLVHGCCERPCRHIHTHES